MPEAPDIFHAEGTIEYDARLALTIEKASEPLTRLRERLERVQLILTLSGELQARVFAQKLVYAAVVGAIEAYLYEVAFFWIDTDQNAFRSLVTNHESFKQEKVPLANIFQLMDDLKDRVRGFLQNTVWHRWDKVAQIYLAAFDVRIPSINDLQAAVLKRHDIVHRSGLDKDGNHVSPSKDKIATLCTVIDKFAVELMARINSRNRHTQENI